MWAKLVHAGQRNLFDPVLDIGLIFHEVHIKQLMHPYNRLQVSGKFKSVSELEAHARSVSKEVQCNLDRVI